MRTINSKLTDALQAAGCTPFIQLSLIVGVRPVTITTERILAYRLHEYGRLGRADLEVVIDNADGAYAWLTTWLGKSFSSHFGAIIDGQAVSVPTGNWIVTDAAASGPGLPESVRVTATNVYRLFNQPVTAATVYTNESMATITTALGAAANVAMALNDEAAFWGVRLQRFTLAKDFSLAFYLGWLLGDGLQTYARAYGRIEPETSQLVLTGIGVSPAVNGTIGAGLMFAAKRLLRRTPSTVTVYGANGLMRRVRSTVLEASEVGRFELFAAEALALYQLTDVNALAERAMAEVIESAEGGDMLLIEGAPDLRLQLWDVVTVAGLNTIAPDLDEATPLRVSEIWLNYKPGRLEFKYLARRTYSDLGLVTTTPETTKGWPVALAAGVDHAGLGYTEGVASDGETLRIEPSTVTPPLVLGDNAQGQRVIGLDADTVDGRHASEFATADHDHPDTIGFTAHTHVQAVPAAVWAVAHNLGRKPSVTVIDSANSEVLGNVTYVSDSALEIAFSGAFSGLAYLV